VHDLPRSPAFTARRTALAGLVLALLGTAAGARAQAFLQWEQSARGLGMGGASAALADDPSASFHNPAGIVRLAGTQVQLGGVLARRDGTFDAFGAPDADVDAGYGAAPALFVTHPLAAYWTGGFSVTEPWRSELDWDDPTGFVGRFRATGSRLQGLSFEPVLAWRPAATWSVAGGVAVVEASFRLDRFEHDPVISAMAGGGPVALARASLDLDATAVGWMAGGDWRPRDDLAASFHYRSRIPVELNGTADFTVVASDSVRELRFPNGQRVGAFVDARYVDQPARSRIVFPAIATGGVTWSPVAPVLLAADVQWIGWGEVESLALAFADTVLADTTALRYDDTWSVRLGAEVRPGGGYRFRVGFSRIQSPAPFAAVGPLFTDADRSSVSLGAGATWRGMDFDAGYRVTVMEDRQGVAFPLNETAADGIYESSEHTFAVAATRRF
jgi:long-chain fatty acid transport protein